MGIIPKVEVAAAIIAAAMASVSVRDVDMAVEEEEEEEEEAIELAVVDDVDIITEILSSQIKSRTKEEKRRKVKRGNDYNSKSNKLYNEGNINEINK